MVLELFITMMALLGCSSGHMIMVNPKTFDTTLPRPDPQTWPLDNTTLLFPCQIGGLTDNLIIKAITPVSAGASILVQFSGSAVHGGGSCQFSINYGDPNSQDPNDWHVIYTLIGGCPASSAGNIETIGEDHDQRPLGRECGNSVDTECVRQFDVPIPKGLKNGNATFAWSWFNKIGNREMYMNCAPIVISDGIDNDDTFLKGLPAIFVADIDGKPCNTAKPEGAVLNKPNPGIFGMVLEPDPDAMGNCSFHAIVPYPKFGAGSTGNTSLTNIPSAAASAGQESRSAMVSEPSSKTLLATILTFTTMTTTSSKDSSQFGITSRFSLHEASVPVSIYPSASYGLLVTVLASHNKQSGWVECDGAASSFVCLNATHFGICNSGYADPQLVPTNTTCYSESNMIAAQK